MPKVCFVTSASSQNINWLIDSLNSIKNNTTYGDLPHYIINIGFTDEDKDLLKKKFPHIEFREPFLEHLPDHARNHKPSVGNHQYPFYCDILSEYELIVHIEADVWILDQVVLDNFFEYINSFDMVLCSNNSGLFIIKNASSFLKLWQQRYIGQIYLNQFHFALQEECLRKLVIQNNIPRLNKGNQIYKHNHTPFLEGISCYRYKRRQNLKRAVTISQNHFNACSKILLWVRWQ